MNGEYQRSSFCTSGSCVEASIDGPAVVVRDSKDLSAPPLRFTPEEWRAFVAGVKAGEFDLPAT